MIAFIQMIESYAELVRQNERDVFTKEELETIMVDVKHIYKCVLLNEVEMIKRNSILNKINQILNNGK